MLEPDRIYLGDCRSLLRELHDESVDLIVTSPPYADSRKTFILTITSSGSFLSQPNCVGYCDRQVRSC